MKRIAFAAAGLLAAASSILPASAGTSVYFGLGVPAPVYIAPPPPPPPVYVYPAYPVYAPAPLVLDMPPPPPPPMPAAQANQLGCGEAAGLIRREGYRIVDTVDCEGGANYTFLASRDGDTFRVRIDSWSGRIVSVSPAYN